MGKPARHFTMRYPRLTKWTVPLIERRTASRIEDAKAALADIIATWGDVDQGVVDDMERWIVDLDKWLVEHREQVRDRLEHGETIGL